MSDNSTHPDILAPVPETAIGPLIIGSWINWMLMGTLIMQTYSYHYRFNDEKRWLRVLVYVVVGIDVVQTVVTSHATWYYAVAHWNDPSVLLRGPWSVGTLALFAGLVSGTVQLFYAWRIWILSRSMWLRALAVLIVTVSITQATSGIVGSIIIQFSLTQERLLQLHPIFAYWLAGSFVADVLITSGMTYILVKVKARTAVSQTKGVLNTLISNCIQTGLITSICAGVDLGLFVSDTSSNFYYVPGYILAKLYTNSLLATLNSRRTARPKNRSESVSNPEVFGMRLQVSRVTEQTSDSSTINGNWNSGKNDAEFGSKPRLESDIL